MKKFLNSFYSFVMCPPKIDRIGFVIRMLFWGLAAPFTLRQSIEIITNTFGYLSGSMGYVVTAVFLLIYLLIPVGMICATIARLNDLKMNKWNVIFPIVPVYGWYVLFKLIFKSGTQACNESETTEKKNIAIGSWTPENQAS